jgi:hypothetical protein
VAFCSPKHLTATGPVYHRSAVTIPEPLRRWPHERLAERVSAAAYGTVLVLAALALLDADNVSNGLGWELVTGVGIATWIAHLYAEVVGDHLRHRSPLDRTEIARAAVDGLPIPLAALPPAVVLFLGRLDVLDARVALWVALVVAFLQLVGVGALTGAAVRSGRSSPWAYAAVTAGIGVVVVVIKLLLAH